MGGFAHADPCSLLRQAELRLLLSTALLLNVGNRTFSLITHFVTTIILLWTVAFWFAILFDCGTNFSAWWISLETASTQCSARLKLELSFAISDAIIDVVVFVLPIHQVFTIIVLKAVLRIQC